MRLINKSTNLYYFQMIKDCMKKVITVNLHQTVKVHNSVIILYVPPCIFYLGSVISSWFSGEDLAPFLSLKSSVFIPFAKHCSRNVGLLTWAIWGFHIDTNPNQTKLEDGNWVPLRTALYIKQLANINVIRLFLLLVLKTVYQSLRWTISTNIPSNILPP